MLKLLKIFPQTYSQELGINLKSGQKEEIFKWFLASILFGARIGEKIAKNTYKAFERNKILTPDKILKAGMAKLIGLMGEGGYVRYDGKTSDKLLKISEKLIKEYQGDLNFLEEKSKDSQDLENRLKEFYGVKEVTTNIFLRELRNIWQKADPDFSPFVKLAAKNLGIKNLKEYWKKNKIKGYDFTNLESALLRLGKNYCSKKKCLFCPIKNYCRNKKYEM